MEKDITQKELLESINRGFSSLEDRFNKIDERFEKIDNRFDKMDDRFDKMDEKLYKVELNLQIQINDVQSDMKSFRQETAQNFKEVNDKLDDLAETDKFFDKRIEVLETVA